MWRTDQQQADPLISPIASFLRAPLLELYAFLWRVGVLEILEIPEIGRSEPALGHHQGRRVAGRESAGVARVAGEPPAAPDRRRHG
ncbi:Rv1535 domain-containing protein [Mycobacterium sp.]|uniref:Rv1535 domain-containing protein n=1 Tax=Mycobacterium sp. TaxID=1785 RepID=UPI003F9C9D32